MSLKYKYNTITLTLNLDAIWFNYDDSFFSSVFIEFYFERKYYALMQLDR